MSHSKQPRLKPLLNTVPPGYMVDTSWLRGRGIDPKSIHDYVARGWLERVVRGVYRRPLPDGAKAASEESWLVPLLSLQWLMNYDVHLGGESALDMAGYSHYLILGERWRVYFYGEVPSWMKRLPVKTGIVVRPRTLFSDDALGIEETEPAAVERQPMVEIWHCPLRMSSPERAILEAIDELPKNTTFEKLDRIFEGLVSLRPNRLMALLQVCRSVKVRRLFFVFADRHQHAWRKHLDISEIDLGSGPRALMEGGKIHPNYHIQVPETFLPGKEREAEYDV